jgi:demethylmenaquinone methyltransferase/2-methoxy-6-polyprenyl-1,4-benzoquinol methylase
MNYQKDNPASIQSMFNSIAENYDRTNAILSFQLHRYWNAQLVSLLLSRKDAGSILDLCSGTGDIAFRFLAKAREPKRAIRVDFCENMLACAKEKAQRFPFSQHSISYVQADVQHLP